MDQGQLQQKLSFADRYLGPFVKRFVGEFIWIRGPLEKIGRMETSTSYSATTLGGSNSSGTGSVHGSMTNIRPTQSNFISLLKVNGKTLTDVYIPSSSIFDAIDVGQEVGMIMSPDEKQIFYVINYSDGTSVGGKPECGSDSYRWWSLGGAGFLGIGLLNDLVETITEFKAPEFGLYALVIFLFLLYRTTDIASKQTKSNWESAMSAVQQR